MEFKTVNDIFPDQWITESLRTARLAHWCDHCLHVIQPRDMYWRAFVICDSKPKTLNFHRWCMRL